MANLTRLSVLIADSDVAQSRRTQDLLGGLGVHDVVCVHTRDSALEWLRARAFDILLCSSKLAAHDGLELVQAARQVSPATRPVLIRSHSRAPQPEGVETLERPFTSARLQGLLQRAAAPLGGLWCEVPQLSLADILQMYHQGRRSITVLLSGPIAGRIRLVQGELVHAESETLEGLAALSRLLEADSGLLRTETSAAESPRTLQGPFERNILAAVQLSDERRRDRTSATPAAASHTVRDNNPRPSSSPEPQPPEEAPVHPAARRPLIFALAFALIAVAVMVAFLSRNIEATGGGPPDTANDQVQSNVQGLAARQTAVDETPPPQTPPPQTAEAPATSPPAAAQGTPTAGDAPRSFDAPKAAPPLSFTLMITSTPPRVSVLERGRVIGKTPLSLPIARSSVARGPREFTLSQPGHQPHVLEQGDSVRDVRAAVVLEPAAEPNDVELDADADFDTSEAAGADRPPRVRKPNLDIRLRR